MDKGEEVNILDAASQGAINAVFLVANIVASLISMIAFVGFLNGLLAWLGSLVLIEGLTFEYVIGKMFIPVAFIMGVPVQVSKASKTFFCLIKEALFGACKSFMS